MRRGHVLRVRTTGRGGLADVADSPEPPTSSDLLTVPHAPFCRARHSCTTEAGGGRSAGRARARARAGSSDRTSAAPAQSSASESRAQRANFPQRQEVGDLRIQSTRRRLRACNS